MINGERPSVKRPPIQFSFRTKIYGGIVSIVLLTGLLIAVPVSQIVSRSLSDDYRKRGVSMAVSLAKRGEDPILAMDFLRMKSLIDEAVGSGEDIFYAFFQNASGDILSHSFQEGFPLQLKTANDVSTEEPFRIRHLDADGDRIYDFAAPVLAGPYQVGTVRLGLLSNKINTTINELLWAIFAFILISVFIADLVGFTLARNVTSRVRSLQEATEAILDGDLNIRVRDMVTPGGSMVDGEESGEGRFDGDLSKEFGGHSVQLTRTGDEIHQLAESFDAVTVALKNNIDQLARSKATLEKSEAKYRRIFEGSMDLIFVADSSGRILDINPAGVSMLEYHDAPDHLRQIPLSSVVREANSTAPLLTVLENQGFVRDWECRMVTRTGSELDVLMSVSSRRNKAGDIIEYDGVVKDITRRKLMRNQLLQADKLASLGQLSAGVAHEINNPLGLILGYTQLLIREDTGNDDRLEDLRTIERQVRNCKQIVEALLKFARKTETRLSEVSINDTVSAVIDVMAHQLELDDIEIVTDFADGLPRVSGDGEKLKQVWMNLMMNARQAIGSDGQIAVSTGLENGGERIYLSIEDTGPGIPSQFLNNIFDPFFTTKPTGQGTGLGLSVSYGIIQDHSGGIEVSSEEGMGAVFTVYLPNENHHNGEDGRHHATTIADR